MFAVDHAATALLVKRRFPSVGMIPILLSVQAMEFAWVFLNFLGVERTTTETSVRSVADVHLALMPYSHSVASACLVAIGSWLILEKGFDRPALGRAVGLGLISHLLLDLVTHASDIALWPFWPSPRVGLGLYDASPFTAFLVEMGYGLLCWAVFRGGRGLLALVTIGNLANLSFLSPSIAGPERLLAGRSMLLVTVILAQIVISLILVGVLSRSPRASSVEREVKRRPIRRAPGRVETPFSGGSLRGGAPGPQPAEICDRGLSGGK